MADDRPPTIDHRPPGAASAARGHRSSVVGRRSIAILHYAGPPTVGGVEVTMAAHARIMAADGHAVRIVTGRGGSSPPPVRSIVIPGLGSRGEVVDVVNRELAAGVAGDAFRNLTAQLTGELRAALDGVDVAMVHNVLTLHKNLAFTAALRRLHDAGEAPGILAWCHDFAWLDPLYAAELHSGEPWDLLREPWPGVHYVVVSEDRRGMLAGLIGLDEAEIQVVTPGVDTAAFLKLEQDTWELVERCGLLEAEPLLLLPARVTRRKNIEGAIAIVAGLRRAGLAPKLVVTGPPGPHNPANAAYLAQLQALRADTGDPDSVVFLYESYTDPAGRPRAVGDEMLADLYRLADALLFTSRYEGFGIPIIEAGLAGLPIYCSDIPPFRETAGEAALFLDVDAPPEESAARIVRAWRDDPRAALRRRVRLTYTWEAIYRRDIAPRLET